MNPITTRGCASWSARDHAQRNRILPASRVSARPRHRRESLRSRLAVRLHRPWLLLARRWPWRQLAHLAILDGRLEGALERGRRAAWPATIPLPVDGPLRPARDDKVP